jgi:hypothetical protein
MTRKHGCRVARAMKIGEKVMEARPRDSTDRKKNLSKRAKVRGGVAALQRPEGT